MSPLAPLYGGVNPPPLAARYLPLVLPVPSSIIATAASESSPFERCASCLFALTLAVPFRE